MIDALLLLVFPAAMALGACCDLFAMKIPNRLTLGFAALFPVAALAAGLPVEVIGHHLIAGAGMLLLAFALFGMGWIGGGDAKLVAATALWVGWPALLPLLIWASLLGGILTMSLLAARRVPLPAALGRMDWLVRLHDARQGIPYGIALAGAGLVVYPQTVWMAVFA
ncbi:A24 family peptidase [Microbaculum marinum]|uniref:Prepilin peptidase n=1 Tax=Microbaculum marinum TaxID=1764581 RepID=A0AAW9S610_9HYPH